MRCIGLCHYYQGEHNNSEKPEKGSKLKTKIENRWGRGGSMLKRELCSPRNKNNGEGKQKLEITRKWGHLTLCYTTRTWVQVFYTELISCLVYWQCTFFCFLLCRWPCSFWGGTEAAREGIRFETSWRGWELQQPSHFVQPERRHRWDFVNSTCCACCLSHVRLGLRHCDVAQNAAI